MRIVHLDAGRELRGGQRQVLLLASGLARRGHSQVILARAEGPLYEEAARRGLPLLPLKAATLAQEARRADVVHAHDARAHTLAALAPAGAPLVVARRVAFPAPGGMLSRWKYGRASLLLAVSEFVKGQLIAGGIDVSRIRVIPDGAEPDGRPPRQPQTGLVVAPETRDPRKGSDLAAEACRLAGVELKFSARLEEDLPRAALFLYLSRSEGLGSAILLAMAHRTPVVASAVGGIPEIVEPERTGLLVENTPEAASAAIRRALASPEWAAGLAAAAHERLLACFTDHLMVERTEQAYREVA